MHPKQKCNILIVNIIYMVMIWWLRILYVYEDYIVNADVAGVACISVVHVVLLYPLCVMM